MKNVKIKIDNIDLIVPEGTTILEAAKKVNINIPHLCYHPDQAIKANCRLCVVEVSGSRKLTPACSSFVFEGMEVQTNTRKVRDMQKGILELILANHDQDCLKCLRNGNCELQALCQRFNISKTNLEDTVDALPLDNTNPSLVRDSAKCVKCNRCVDACQKVQEVHVLTHSHRSVHYNIAPAYEMPLEKTFCVFCGQCAAVCPVGAIVEKDDTQKVWDAIHDPKKHVIVQVAPAVRVALGDAFNLPKGSIVTGQMVAALRRLGFDKIFDTNFTADLTILEEGNELIKRVTDGGTLPMITSCSPGWIKFMETYYPDLADCVSTAKSPMSMFGVLSKTYYAQEHGIDPTKIVSVAIMPCTAKKFEARRPEMRDSGYQDTDYVLTTREFLRMIKEAGIDFANIKDEDADEGMSFYTGAGTIFGATGGVMEAAIRSAYTLVTGEELENVEIQAVRGLDGVKEATIPVPGFGDLKVAVAHGLSNARKVMDRVREGLKTTGESPWHFIEIMACPGGCVGGGGQPYGNDIASRARRGLALYEEDRSLPVRKSHQNPEVLKIYERFLGAPNSPLAHKLLHTHYFKRSISNGQVVEEVTHKHH